MTELERVQAELIEQLREENRLLRQNLDHVIRQLYGSKSEKLDLAQLDLFGDLDGPGKPEASPAPEGNEAAEALIATASPFRLRAFGGKGAEGLKKNFTSRHGVPRGHLSRAAVRPRWIPWGFAPPYGR